MLDVDVVYTVLPVASSCVEGFGVFLLKLNPFYVLNKLEFTVFVVRMDKCDFCM